MFVGIDVSKDQLELAWRTPSGLKRERLAYHEAELQALVARLQTAERIVVEATGGYERLLVAALAAAGLPCCCWIWCQLGSCREISSPLWMSDPGP